MNDHDSFVNSINPDSRVAVIENIGHRIDKSYKLKDGVRMGDIHYPSTILEIHKDSGDMVTDFIDNIDRCVIISERVKKVFEEEGLDDEKVEYLPFVFHDKRKREIKTQYYIANSIVTIDCMDFEKSECIKNKEIDDPAFYGIISIQVNKGV